MANSRPLICGSSGVLTDLASGFLIGLSNSSEHWEEVSAHGPCAARGCATCARCRGWNRPAQLDGGVGLVVVLFARSGGTLDRGRGRRGRDEPGLSEAAESHRNRRRAVSAVQLDCHLVHHSVAVGPQVEHGQGPRRRDCGLGGGDEVGVPAEGRVARKAADRAGC